MSSASVGDPQSLNLYPYVGNNPIDFVDPLGLDDDIVLPNEGVTINISFDDPIDGLPGGGLGGKFIDRELLPLPEMPVIEDVINEVVTIVAAANRVSSQNDKLPFNSCDEFVSWMINSLLISMNKTKTNIDNWDTANYVGGGLMRVAFWDYAKHIDNGTTGFKDKLVKPGNQNGGVYGHILFQSGAYLAGAGTYAIGIAAHMWDIAQGKLKNETLAMFTPLGKKIGLVGKNDRQASAKMDGNIARTNVGGHLWQFINGKRNGRDQNTLRKNLEKELCK